MSSEHTDECASGARAERRGPCNCGAVKQRSWRVRAVSPSLHGIADEPDDLIEVIFTRDDGYLDTSDAIALALTLQALTIETSHRNVARREAVERRTIKTVARLAFVSKHGTSPVENVEVESLGDDDDPPWEVTGA